jgi:hypothetical protein
MFDFLPQWAHRLARVAFSAFLGAWVLLGLAGILVMYAPQVGRWHAGALIVSLTIGGAVAFVAFLFSAIVIW